MPKKTRKEKMLAQQRKTFSRPKLIQNEIESTVVNEKIESKKIEPVQVQSLSKEEIFITKYFQTDLRKSLIIIGAIFALEFFFYFATMNNYLARYLNF